MIMDMWLRVNDGYSMKVEGDVVLLVNDDHWEAWTVFDGEFQMAGTAKAKTRLDAMEQSLKWYDAYLQIRTDLGRSPFAASVADCHK